MGERQWQTVAERYLQGREILIMVRPSCFHVYIDLHLASGPESRMLYACVERALFEKVHL